jgi:hypothetical protein
MKSLKLITTATLFTSLISCAAFAQSLPENYWTQAQAAEILDKTRRVMLDPDLSVLSDGERAAVEKLLKAGAIMNRLYQDSMHPEALASLQALQNLHGGATHTGDLLDLYYMFKGPIASTLDNRRVPFLPVTAESRARMFTRLA